MAKLDSLSPLAVVDRGYSIATTNNKVLKSVKDVKAGEVVDVRLADGHFSAEVKSISKKNN